MRATLNRQLFTIATFDSGSLGMLASVVHQFSTPGRYQAAIQRHGVPAGTTEFEVSAESETMQLSIDLADSGPSQRSECECERRKATVPTLSSRGYVLFFASSGTSGYSVVVGEVGEKGAPHFDSQNLTSGDLFALSILEPTSYGMINRAGKASGEIVVSFSSEDAKRLKSLETQFVDVSKIRFDPATVGLTSTQGLVFRVHDNARIVIEKRSAKPRKDERPKAIRFTRRLFGKGKGRKEEEAR